MGVLVHDKFGVISFQSFLLRERVNVRCQCRPLLSEPKLATVCCRARSIQRDRGAYTSLGECIKGR